MNERGTKRKPLKGAVLFTVLCVMAVVLIMMLVTIGLSGVASRRAYSEYYDAQINATGRSVVNSVLKSLDPVSGANKDLGKTIYQQVGSTGSYEVHLSNGGNLGQGLGRVDKIVFEDAGIDSESDFFVSGSDYMIMKVTATITMGNKTTTYTEYVSDMAHVPGKNGGNGGLLSTSGADTSGTGMTILGPFGGGFKDYVKQSSTLELKDYGAYIGQNFFAQSININTFKSFIFDANTAAKSYSLTDLSAADYQGISILGNLKITNDGCYFVSKSATVDALSTPYIFMTGKLDLSGTTQVYIGSPSSNVFPLAAQSDFIKQTSGNKVNIYCGSFEFPKNKMNIASDIYCYNESAESVLGGDMNDTPLLNWAEQQVNTGTIIKGNTISGNIYTKGDLKLSQTKVAVNGNIYIDGQLVLTDISKSSQQIPDISGGKIYCKAVNPTDYTNIEGASDQYKNLVSKIEIVASNSFPDDMELENVLGVTFDSSITTGSAKLNAIDTGDYSLTGSIDFSKKIIQNPMEMNMKFYMDVPGSSTKVLRNSYSQSGVTNTATVYTNADVPDTITGQCVLKGEFKGKTIVIKPPTKASGANLWITLDGVSMTDYGSDHCQIIVENKVDDGTGNMVEAGPVCFYVKDGTRLDLRTGSRIVTRYYADEYLDTIGNHSKLKKEITINNGSLAPEMIPNIYIYGSNREDEVGDEEVQPDWTGAGYGPNTGKREVLNFENYSLVTAYIVAPRAVLRIGEMGDKGADVIYEGTKYKDVRVGIIGSAIVGPIRDAKNYVSLLYVDNSAGGTPVPPSDLFKYQPLPGFTNY